jgi:ADP-ribose pyrophosphatase
MVRQHRPAIERFTLELPAGKIDEVGESKKACAARELEEETGYKASALELLVTVDTTVAICNEEIEIYLATGLVKTAQHLDEDEDINVEAYKLDDLIEMIRRQEIKDSKTVAGILAYKVLADR